MIHHQGQNNVYQLKANHKGEGLLVVNLIGLGQPTRNFMSFVLMNLLDFEIDKPSKIPIKTLNAMEYIESDRQNIEAPRKDDPII